MPSSTLSCKPFDLKQRSSRCGPKSTASASPRSCLKPSCGKQFCLLLSVRSSQSLARPGRESACVVSYQQTSSDTVSQSEHTGKVAELHGLRPSWLSQAQFLLAQDKTAYAVKSMVLPASNHKTKGQ
ncbi:LOW QUALITY PROTEIN: putative uncharacterized protein C1orf195 homolog [Papio anubis]|uniref:LOW QUALITY PROTEIN: putative uncharacterized protein C1orf195 homolog n=1 Tax=Papio anubis TaxID=9555 RepID=UPI0004F1E31A|nr:LOW QUALITY PROTEIN: putative uncharacterized protein C1orf195 homolog [Papio anubis]